MINEAQASSFAVFDGNLLHFYGIADKVRGIETLQIMIKFIPVFEVRKAKSGYNKLKSFLVCKLQAGIKPEEEERLLQGILKYIGSESGSNERIESMKYLFNLKFLNQSA